MKILSDFDGVLTEQTEEANRVRELFRERMLELSGLVADQVDDLISRAEQAMSEQPTAHGWRAKGRVTAYADEDLFIRNNGLAACFDAWMAAGDELLTEALERLRGAGMGDYTALANWAYTEMTKETSRGEHKPIDPATADVMSELLERGDDVVIVSNSGTQRIVEMLQAAGIPAPSGRLRVRGDARKYELADEPRSFEAAGFQIEVGRPSYEEILREERPDMVIGDVFSLDLALPLFLARTEPDLFGGLRLVLRTRAYTPAWARGLFEGASEEQASFHLLDQLEGLCDIG